ncbi:ribulokinase [Sphingobacterium mizutaii NBRC 14946 = DSM 11724]|uniref:Ribulokinase n=2 Tax=Sphingobacterium mizutaii TaxID=1010 RepID=A0AAJ5BZN1_9SPHI|nr:ribulokinase [Sphingobacterium mizutaii]GEM68853.1 ribulokinase [Sphingobacterium mizutaii NBRC 14946 = DSM 11724]SDK89975.1 L-ribulokinase [Sphingobacterium mizutaii]SNV47146.1 Ribulokinase [Sphingobacterium mizutaii]
MKQSYVIGVDFGTDSARALLVDSANGEVLGSATSSFKRWKEGLYCDPKQSQFRQHPLDYIESLEACLKGCLANANDEIKANVLAISIDATGSTPVAIDRHGQPLALSAEFSENPNAMFFLWKDHSSIKEVEEINQKAQGLEVNYLSYCGGAYSSEWFWSKLLHMARTDEEVYNATHSWLEQSDWLPYLLTGNQDAQLLKRNVCAAGHKALWAQELGGYPPLEFFTHLDPKLEKIYHSINKEVFTADELVGNLSKEWADKLGLKTDVLICVGAIDAHVGAIGAQIQPGYMCKVMGTSTCDMMVIDREELQDRLVQGICGQVQGSIVPQYIGLEAGQSAFGDVYNWLKNLLLWPIKNSLKRSASLGSQAISDLRDELERNLLSELSELAKQQPIQEDSELALDWFNGRRTPDVNPSLTAALFNLDLGSNPVNIFQALVEATCFGSRAIVEHVENQGVAIQGVIGIGGIAKKSDYVMQTLADVLQRPIMVHRSDETCAMGACMLAATAAGIYTSLSEAMDKMGSGFEKEYLPNPEKKELFDKRYAKYLAFGSMINTVE